MVQNQKLKTVRELYEQFVKVRAVFRRHVVPLTTAERNGGLQKTIQQKHRTCSCCFLANGVIPARMDSVEFIFKMKTCSY